MLVMVYALAARITEDVHERRAMLWFAALGSGLGWLVVFLGYRSADLWVPEAFPMYALLANAHFPLSMGLMAGIACCVLRIADSEGRAWHWGLAATLGACEPVFNAAFTAIARHHGAFTRQGRRYTLVSSSDQAVAETLNLLPAQLIGGPKVELWSSEDPSEASIREFFVNPAQDGEFLAYVLLARALRRADQLGTVLGSS